MDASRLIVSTLLLYFVERSSAIPSSHSEPGFFYEDELIEEERYMEGSEIKIRTRRRSASVGPENRRKQCIRYEGYCDRENEHDNCCLERGGICKTRPGRGRTCTPPPKYEYEYEIKNRYLCFNDRKDVYEKLNEEQILGWGFSGGAVWERDSKKVRTSLGAAKLISDDDVVYMRILLDDVGLCHRHGSFLLVNRKYICHGTKDVEYVVNGKMYHSYWIQGISDDDLHGVVVISTLKNILVGMHVMADLDWWPANFRLGSIAESLIAAEKELLENESGK